MLFRNIVQVNRSSAFRSNQYCQTYQSSSTLQIVNYTDETSINVTQRSGFVNYLLYRITVNFFRPIFIAQ